MSFTDPEKILHVVSGPSAAGCLKQALRIRNHQVLVGDNELHYGPAPAMADLFAWYRMRKVYSDDLISNYLACTFDAPEPVTVSIGEEPETGPHIDGERLSEASEVHLWITQGLAEQLLLALIVFLFDRFQFDHSKLRVIQFERSHQNWPLLTVGELSPEAINRLSPGPKPLRAEQIAELRSAWQAYTSDSPKHLLEHLAAPSSLPFLHRAIERLIYRYPDARIGLNQWDQALLQQSIENGPFLHRVIGHAMAEWDTPDWVSDGLLFDRIWKLGGPDVKTPLFTLSSGPPPKKRPHVEITDFGRRVLSGEANHVAENGIDDWVGGVHLTPDTVVFRDGDTLLLR